MGEKGVGGLQGMAAFEFSKCFPNVWTVQNENEELDENTNLEDLLGGNNGEEEEEDACDVDLVDCSGLENLMYTTITQSYCPTTHKCCTITGRDGQEYFNAVRTHA